jgi:hypothetical protein
VTDKRHRSAGFHGAPPSAFEGARSRANVIRIFENATARSGGVVETAFGCAREPLSLRFVTFGGRLQIGGSLRTSFVPL